MAKYIAKIIQLRRDRSGNYNIKKNCKKNGYSHKQYITTNLSKATLIFFVGNAKLLDFYLIKSNKNEKKQTIGIIFDSQIKINLDIIKFLNKKFQS